MATVQAPRIQPHSEGGPFRNEPLVDFSRPENARRMREAIEKVRNELGREYDLVIGEKRLRTEKKIRSFNPAKPSELIGVHQRAGCEHVASAMHAALRAVESCKRSSIAERAELLCSRSDLLSERRLAC